MTNTIDNKKIYDDTWADWVDMKIYGSASRWLRFLILKQTKQLKSDTGIKKVLDVGSGEGTITNMLAEEFPNAEVLGVDFSVNGIECAKRRM